MSGYFYSKKGYLTAQVCLVFSSNHQEEYRAKEENSRKDPCKGEMF